MRNSFSALYRSVTVCRTVHCSRSKMRVMMNIASELRTAVQLQVRSTLSWALQFWYRCTQSNHNLTSCLNMKLGHLPAKIFTECLSMQWSFGFFLPLPFNILNFISLRFRFTQLLTSTNGSSPQILTLIRLKEFALNYFSLLAKCPTS